MEIHAIKDLASANASKSPSSIPGALVPKMLLTCFVCRLMTWMRSMNHSSTPAAAVWLSLRLGSLSVAHESSAKAE